MTLIFEVRSHVGKVRNNNQDNYVGLSLAGAETKDNQRLLLVADGVGGRVKGEVASQICVDTFTELVKSAKLPATTDHSMREMLLRMAVQKAHVQIARHSRQYPDTNGMSCTLTLAVADSESVTLAQVGDSRLYLYAAATQALAQISRDQTVAQLLVQEGRLNPSELNQHPDRNTLSQSMGLEAVGAPMEPVLESFAWHKGDRIMLCSDGLTDMVGDEHIQAVLAASENCSQAVNQLIQAALDGGGKDNVTVIVCENQILE